MRTKLAVAGLGLLLGGVPLSAHHAFAAEFDSNLPISLKGVVTKVEWINPHAWIHIDARPLTKLPKTISVKVPCHVPDA